MPQTTCSTVWSWNFGDGNGHGNGEGTSTDQNPAYMYTKSNTNPGFIVTLQVSNSMGSDTKTAVIAVYP